MPPRKKKPQPGSVGLAADEVTQGTPPPALRTLAEQVAADGGSVLAQYREPFGAGWVLFVSLPVDKIEPTPFQRELSPTHAERLAGVIPKVGHFLDPVIAIREGDAYWTPNGMHRLTAMKKLGARSIMALLLPSKELAYRILALNTEKAHNLKDRSLEVVRMARALAAAPETAKRPEKDWAFEFEEAAYLTIGACYEENGRFSGGAYLPVVKRTEEFLSAPIKEALKTHDAHARDLLALDAAVNDVVTRLKEAGLKSAYLKPFVVARINPLRFVKAARPGQKAPRADFDTTIEKMMASARKLDASKVRPQDIASMGGGAAPEE